MGWSDLNEERRAARNRRHLLGRILTGQAALEEIKLDRVLIGFSEVGSNISAGLIFCEGAPMSASEFQRLAALHKQSIIFQEVVVTRDPKTGELIEVDFQAPIDDDEQSNTEPEIE